MVLHRSRSTGRGMAGSLPMISDLDIWRSAQVMVERFGENAPLEAAKRADELLGQGDMDGSRVWQRIMKAAEDLLRDKPEQGQSVH